ncbi:HMA2 domain-containing protein [Methylomonas sp. MgM2]
MPIADLPKAFIKHQMPGRARLKIPGKRGDERYFEQLAEIFAGCEAITQLQINAQTASLLIQHDSSPLSDIVAFAGDAGLFVTVQGREAELMATEHSSIAKLSSLAATHIDHKLADLSAGRVDVRSVLFLGFMGLAVREATKGHVMAPASTFLWRALQLLNQKNDKFFE